MAQGRNISAKSVLGYVFLPRVVPRARNLFANGFGFVAYMMAHVYAMVRLLPANHPYLQSKSIGHFGIRHVIAAAARNLKWRWSNIDQIVIFGAMMTGAVLILLQILSLVYSFLMRPALAGGGGGPSVSFFNTPNPVNDIALNLMDRMFGVPQIFCNFDGICTSIHSTLPTPFHVGLHGMLQFYSLGILIVGALIFLYYIVIIVGETATSGTPFGNRFQNIWVPVRLIVSIGLLLPLNYGLNSAQYITLYAAKWGSGFATNAWIQFNRAIANQGEVFGGAQFVPGGANPLGEKESLISRVRAPDFSPVVQFVSLAHACRYSYIDADRGLTLATAAPYLVKLPPATSGPGVNMETYKAVTPGTSYEDALAFYNNGDIVIRFGERNEDKYKDHKGGVGPLCGDIRLHVGDLSNKGTGTTTGGPDYVQRVYFEQVKRLWFNDTVAKNLAFRYVAYETTGDDPCAWEVPGAPNCDRQLPPASVKQELVRRYNLEVKNAVDDAWEMYREAGIGTELTQEIADRGWGGAGIWYNTIARINGGFMDAVQAVPSASIDEYPEIMVKVRKEKEGQDNDTTGITMFEPKLKDGRQLKILSPRELWQAQKMSSYFRYWNENTPEASDTDKVITGNAFKDAMNFIFGTTGLFAMREENANIHPLAQLSGVGKSLIDNSIRNIGLSSGFAFMGGIMAQMQMNKGAAAAEIASSVLSSTAFIGLTAGVIMFYILPFMPFLYFFFAVGEWVKGIFEAMVGVPLWAIAHMRLDGEGLPGDAASTGYFLILEIFLRPILILFGLMASLIIFTAQVRILHFIWDIVVANLTGYEKDPMVDFFGLTQFSRGIIDQFFFTVIYAIIVYMLATASFKLIDSIPDNLLRWLGVGTPTFGDMQRDSLSELNQYAATSGIVYGREAVSNLVQISRTGGQGIGGILNSLGPSTPKPPPPTP